MTYVSSAGQQASVMLYKENVRFYGTLTDAAKNRTDIAGGNSGSIDRSTLTQLMPLK